MNPMTIEILVLAGIAVFLVLRLRSVLGTREGFEKPPLQDAAPSKNARDFRVIDGGEDTDITDNVDKKSPSAEALARMKKVDADFIFPVHPRTMKQLKEYNLYSKLKNSKNIILLNSVGYFEILELMKNCSFILSDSGGIQEESTASSIRKKVLVLRKTTDRPESVKDGFSTVIGTQESKILKNIKKTMDNPTIKSRNNPFGKGNASEKIIKILKTSF